MKTKVFPEVVMIAVLFGRSAVQFDLKNGKILSLWSRWISKADGWTFIARLYDIRNMCIVPQTP